MLALFSKLSEKIFLILIFTLIGFSAAYSQDTEVEREITEAIENAKSGKYEQAISVLKKYAESKKIDDFETLQINVYLNLCYLETEDKALDMVSLNKLTVSYIEKNGISKNQEETYLFYLLGNINGSIGDFEKMIFFSLKVKEYYDENEISKDGFYVQILHLLGWGYQNLGDYKLAIDYGQESYAINAELFGEINEFSLKNLNLIYSSYWAENDFQNSLKHILKWVEIGKEFLGEEDDIYLAQLLILSDVYRQLGDYPKFLEINLNVERLAKPVWGEKTYEYLTIQNNLAFSYSNLGEYQKALEINLKVVDGYKEILGEKNADYLTSLENLSNSYSYLGDYQSAKEILEKVVETGKEVLGEKHPNYIRSLGSLAFSYSGLGEYQEALEINLKVVEGNKEILGEKHPDYFTSLDNLAGTYTYLGDYKNALEIYSKAIESGKETLGETHPLYLRILGSLALCYSNLGDYYLALETNQQVVELAKEVLGDKHPEYLTSLENSANFYSSLGKYQTALEINKNVVFSTKGALGEKHPNYLRSLGNLATTLILLGDYNSALEIFLIVAETGKDIWAEKNLDYLTNLENLAYTYSLLGNYHSALEVNQKVVELGNKFLGKEHPNYLRSLSNLANKYSDIGDYDRAIKIHSEVLEIGLEVWGEYHPIYNSALSNLGLVYSDIGNFQKALEIHTEVVEFRKEFFGENHPDYLSSLGNLASAFSGIGDNQKALEIIEEVVESERKILGENHPDYLISLGNLAYYYSNFDDLQSALEINLKVVELEKEVLGEKHPSYHISLANLAFVNLDLGKYDSALSFFNQSLNLERERAINYFGQLTENQRENLWAQSNFSFRVFPLFLETATNSQPDKIINAYDIALFTKGLLLNTSIDFNQLISEKGTPEAISKYEDLKLLKLQIQRLYEKPIAERYLNLDSLETLAQKLETELVKLSKEYGDYTQNLKITWKEVQSNLGDNDVAIEFLEYPTLTDTVKYAALVLRKGWSNPEFIPLFRKDQIDELIKLDKNQIYSNGFVGKEIRKLIWNPLEEFILPGEQVYFSAAGILHQLAIENLAYDESATMGDRYQIFRLSSTKDLALKRSESKTPSITLYGGIKYDLEIDKMMAEHEKYNRTDTFYSMRGIGQDSTSRNGWQFLPGTLAEANEVSRILAENQYQVTEFIGEIGSEESFKDLSGKRPGILHVATHGFFLPVEESKRNRFMQVRLGDEDENRGYVDPMLRSGLMLAGGNRAWMGDSIPDSIEDGILTAKEISHLDLRGTDLVVLSACETGLGDVSSEGVFGLQRSFKQAGAQTIIMSLWNVKDEATQYLMTNFYSYLMQGASKREAFIQARNKCREKYPDPVYWAAFILLD